MSDGTPNCLLLHVPLEVIELIADFLQTPQLSRTNKQFHNLLAMRYLRRRLTFKKDGTTTLDCPTEYGDRVHHCSLWVELEDDGFYDDMMETWDHTQALTSLTRNSTGGAFTQLRHLHLNVENEAVSHDCGGEFDIGEANRLLKWVYKEWLQHTKDHLQFFVLDLPLTRRNYPKYTALLQFEQFQQLTTLKLPGAPLSCSKKNLQGLMQLPHLTTLQVGFLVDPLTQMPELADPVYIRGKLVHVTGLSLDEAIATDGSNQLRIGPHAVEVVRLLLPKVFPNLCAFSWWTAGDGWCSKTIPTGSLDAFSTEWVP